MVMARRVAPAVMMRCTASSKRCIAVLYLRPGVYIRVAMAPLRPHWPRVQCLNSCSSRKRNPSRLSKPDIQAPIQAPTQAAIQGSLSERNNYHDNFVRTLVNPLACGPTVNAYDGRDVRQCNAHRPIQIPPHYHLRKCRWCPNYPQGSEDSIVPCDPTLPCSRQVPRRIWLLSSSEPLVRQYIGPHNPDAPIQPVSDHNADHVPAEHSVQELATGAAEHTEPSNTYNLTHNPYGAKVEDAGGDDSSPR